MTMRRLLRGQTFVPGMASVREVHERMPPSAPAVFGHYHVGAVPSPAKEAAPPSAVMVIMAVLSSVSPLLPQRLVHRARVSYFSVAPMSSMPVEREYPPQFGQPSVNARRRWPAGIIPMTLKGGVTVSLALGVPLLTDFHSTCIPELVYVVMAAQERIAAR